MEVQKICLSCKQTIKGRSDKKFCDDNCRSNYNRICNNEHDINYVRIINLALKKNRNILKTLNVAGKTKVWKTTMVTKGFDFGYYTSIYETGKRNRYYFCYDMGYLLINETEVLLVKKEIYSGSQARK